METQEQAKNKLIDLLEGQVTDLVLMSKIELGDDVIQEIKRLKEIINTKQVIQSLEEEAETFAKTRTELDPVYANGLYYGFIECAKSEWFKEQINEAYNQGQMDGFGLEEKDDYHNEKYGNNHKLA